jgi:hypothetical protein
MGLLVATPLYYPYPRLTLPWLCGVWLGAGWGIGYLTRILSQPLMRGQKGWRVLADRPSVGWACLLVSWALILPKIPGLAEKGVLAWQSRDGLRGAAERLASGARQLAADAGQPWQGTVVFVYGEPALLYQLYAEGVPLVLPTQTPTPRAMLDADLAGPVLLATGPHAHHSPEFQQQWDRASGNLRLVGRHAYRPSDLVLLDQNDPRTPKWPRSELLEEVRWYVAR